MARAPFQVLVFPFLTGDSFRYALFRRMVSEGGYWQAIAGGGENEETPIEAAAREANEEAGIAVDSDLFALDSVATIPVTNVSGFVWGPDMPVIPEYAFAVQVPDADLTISAEHTEYAWFDYQSASQALHWDSNVTALWELDYRLRNSIWRARQVQA